MKYLFLFSFVLLVVSCGNPQPETDPAINIPVEESATEIISNIPTPNLMGGINLANQNVCRANMQSLATSIVMHQAQHGELPATLEEVGSAICPDGGAYRYVVSGQSWTIDCPASPSHGSITDGAGSW